MSTKVYMGFNGPNSNILWCGYSWIDNLARVFKKTFTMQEMQVTYECTKLVAEKEVLVNSSPF